MEASMAQNENLSWHSVIIIFHYCGIKGPQFINDMGGVESTKQYLL